MIKIDDGANGRVAPNKRAQGARTTEKWKTSLGIVMSGLVKIQLRPKSTEQNRKKVEEVMERTKQTERT